MAQPEVGKSYRIAQTDSHVNRFIGKVVSVGENIIVVEIVAPVEVSWNIFKKIGTQVELTVGHYAFGEL